MAASKHRKPLDGPFRGTRNKGPGVEEISPDETPIIRPKVDYPAQADDKPVLEPYPQPAKRRKGGTDRMHVL